MKRKLLDLQDNCQAKKQSIPTDVAETVKLAQESLQWGAGVNAVPSSEVSVTSDGDAATFAGMSDKGKAGLVGLECTETIIVRRHEDLLEKI